MITGLSTLYENKQFTDVILVVGDQEFYCHRNILAISSPFFMAMFTHDMSESHQLRIPLKVCKYLKMYHNNIPFFIIAHLM